MQHGEREGDGRHAVAERRSIGLADNWLRHVEDIAVKHARLLDETASEERRAALLCELNVIEQVANVSRTTIARRAWYRGHRMEVHGLVYALTDGLLRRVGLSVDGTQSWSERYEASLKSLRPAQASGD